MNDIGLQINEPPRRVDISSGYYGHHVRLATLIRLRWIAVAGQFIGLCLVAFILNYEMPVLFPLALMALSAWLNVMLSIRFAKVTRVSPTYTGLLLCYDILQLAGLLFMTGGIENPFAILLLAPVTISATSLSVRWTRIHIALVLSAIVFLSQFHYPLPRHIDEIVLLPPHHTMGMMPALICALFFIATYAGRIAHEARQLANALSATELVLAREQHLSALDGLAAAAAHELGSPLATIALVAKEMGNNEGDEQAMREDIALLKEQSDRCRTILSRLTSMQTEGGHPYECVSFEQLLEECIAPHRNFGITIHINRIQIKSQSPMINRSAGLVYGLGNLIENAVDFAKSEVYINISWTAKRIKLEVIDDGPGFAPEILSRLGDPYTTTRPRDFNDSDPVEPGGLGLGIFIAKTLLQRTGAKVSFSNMQEESNACVIIAWPTSSLEVNDQLFIQSAHLPALP